MIGLVSKVQSTPRLHLLLASRQLPTAYIEGVKPG